MTDTQMPATAATPATPTVPEPATDVLPDERPISDTPATPAPDAAPTEASAPATPTVPDETPWVDTYEPSLKLGIHRLLCQIEDFGPSTKQDTGEFLGWSLTASLAQAAPDSAGGQIEQGTRLPKLTIFTTPGDYGRDVAKTVQNALLGLNNIPCDNRKRDSVAKAREAWLALPPDKKLPHANSTDASHYAQWKGTLVVLVVQSKVDKEGNPRTNCLGIEAASTAKA